MVASGTMVRAAERGQSCRDCSRVAAVFVMCVGLSHCYGGPVAPRPLREHRLEVALAALTHYIRPYRGEPIATSIALGLEGRDAPTAFLLAARDLAVEVVPYGRGDCCQTPYIDVRVSQRGSSPLWDVTIDNTPPPFATCVSDSWSNCRYVIRLTGPRAVVVRSPQCTGAIM